MPTKLNFKIGDLARRLGITTRTIRYYEELGLLDSQDRPNGEHRTFSERIMIKLKRIQQLKDYGLTLTEIAEIFELSKKDRSGDEVRILLLSKYQNRMAKAIKKREVIDKYISELSWHIEQLENVKNFFDCPGLSCMSCDWQQRCDIHSCFSEKETMTQSDEEM